jgi:hypothetical protein
MEAADEPQGQVDPGRDTLAGDEVAVDDVAGVPRDGDLPAGGEVVLVGVVGGDPPSPRRAGFVQQEGPGADAGDPARVSGGVADTPRIIAAAMQVGTFRLSPPSSELAASAAVAATIIRRRLPRSARIPDGISSRGTTAA